MTTIPFTQRIEQLERITFLGGPSADFESIGREQLIWLLRSGLYPCSKVLDVGCGCLRGGYWLIHFLDPDCYCGIEPNQLMLQAGLDHLLEPGLAETKRPRFDHNDQFDSSMFGEKFDFFLARSIWTHTSKDQLRASLDDFVRHSTPDGVFLASYAPVKRKRTDYLGSRWIGHSHESDGGGVVFHSFSWLQQECRERGLEITQYPETKKNRQIWVTVRHA